LICGRRSPPHAIAASTTSSGSLRVGAGPSAIRGREAMRPAADVARVEVARTVDAQARATAARRARDDDVDEARVVHAMNSQCAAPAR
jgi:hypothetical protein